MNAINSGLQRPINFKSIAQWLGGIVSSLGAIVVLAWVFNIMSLTSIFPGFPTMKFNTALLFSCSGLALLLRVAEKKRYTDILAWFIFIIAGASLLEYQFGWNLGIDELLVKDTLSTQYAGRMSVATASNFVLVALSLLTLNRATFLSQLSALLLGFNAFVAISVYIDNPNILSEVFFFETMAIHTATGFILLMFGLLFVNRRSQFYQIIISNSLGALLLKRILLFAFLIFPILFAAIKLGESLGWYPRDFSQLLDRLFNVAIWLWIIRWTAGQVHEIDAQRIAAQIELEHINTELDQRVQEQTADLLAAENRHKQAEIIGQFGHWERDFEQDKIYWSKGIYRIFGISDDTTISFETFLKTIYEDDLERVRETIQFAVQNRQDIDMEYRIVRSDGEIRFVYVTTGWQESESGVSHSYIGTIQDITERKKLEQNLRMYHTAVQVAGELITIVDKDYRYVVANELYLESHMVQQEELIGSHMAAILGDELFNTVIKEHFDRCLMGEIQNFETISNFAKLGKRNLLVNYSPLREPSGEINHVVIFIRDITDRKQVEEKLSFTEARTSGILETAHDGIISIDEQQEIILFNKGAERIFGYADYEILGKSLNNLLPEKYRHTHGTFIDSFGQSSDNTKIMGFERSKIKGLKKDGSQFLAEVSISHHGEEGAMTYTAVIRDITERVEQEQKLRDANIHLSAVNKELEAFSYSVSHDLRAPLRAIDGFSQALLEDYEDKLDEEGQEYLQIVRTECQQMGNLIDDLIKLSRYTRGEIHYEKVDLSAIAQKIAETLQKQEPQREAQFIIDDSIRAYGDEALLRIVLQNLLGNAWKYTSKQAETRIEFGHKYENGKKEYFVSDNGVGFNMAYAHKLFGAFQRLHGRNEFEGTGIGLATVQRIIHRHGGTVRAEARVNEGATFYFTLAAGSHEQ